MVPPPAPDPAPAALARAIHAQWLAANAGFRTPAAIVLYSLAIAAVAALGLVDAGRALLGPEPAALITTLALVLAVIWTASFVYHRQGPETRAYRAADHAETIGLQVAALLLVALTPGARSLFWIVYLGHMTMLPVEPPGRRLVHAVVLAGPLVVALVFLARGDLEGAAFSLAGATAGAATWRLSQSDKRALATHMAGREQLAREVERLSVHDARLALARDLHGGLGAHLDALMHEADRLVARGDAAADARLAGEIGGLSVRARASLDELRAAVWLVAHPERTWPELVAHLAASLRELVRGEVTLVVEVEAEPGAAGARIAGPVCVALLRVLQEATRNALTHGRATRLEVRLVLDRGDVRATVVDDGRGGAPFREQGERSDPGARPQQFREKGSGATRNEAIEFVGKGGLLNMQARAAQLGGEVVVTPGASGTRVALRLPRALAASAAEVAA